MLHMCYCLIRSFYVRKPGTLQGWVSVYTVGQLITDSCNRHRVKWATWQFDIHVWLLQQSQTWMPKYLSGSYIPRQRTHFQTAAPGTGGLSFIFIKISPLLHGNTRKMWEEFPVEKEKTAANKCSQIRNLIGSTLHFPPLITNPLS